MATSSSSQFPPLGGPQQPINPQAAEAIARDQAAPPISAKTKDEISPSSASGKKRSGSYGATALDPLDGVRPKEPFVGFAASQKPQRYNLLDAISLMETLFTTQGKQADVLLQKIDALTTQLNDVLGQIIDATTQQGILQSDIADQAEPAWEKWLVKGAQVVGSGLIGFMLGGPVGAVAAMVTTITMEVLSDPASFGIKGMAPSFGPDGWFTKMSDRIADFFTTLVTEPPDPDSPFPFSTRAFTGPLDHDPDVRKGFEVGLQIAFAVGIGLATGSGFAALADIASSMTVAAADEALAAGEGAAARAAGEEATGKAAADTAEGAPKVNPHEEPVVEVPGEAPVAPGESLAEEASDLEEELEGLEAELQAGRSGQAAAPGTQRAKTEELEKILEGENKAAAGKVPVKPSAKSRLNYDGLRSKAWMAQQTLSATQGMGTWNTFALDCVEKAHPEWTESKKKEWATYIALGINITLMIGSGVGIYATMKGLGTATEVVSAAAEDSAAATETMGAVVAHGSAIAQSLPKFMLIIQGVQMLATGITSAYDSYRFGKTVPLLYQLGDIQEQMRTLTVQSVKAKLYVDELQKTFQGGMGINSTTGDTVRTIIDAWERPIELLSRHGA